MSINFETFRRKNSKNSLLTKLNFSGWILINVFPGLFDGIPFLKEIFTKNNLCGRF